LKQPLQKCGARESGTVLWMVDVENETKETPKKGVLQFLMSKNKSFLWYYTYIAGIENINEVFLCYLNDRFVAIFTT